MLPVLIIAKIWAAYEVARQLNNAITSSSLNISQEVEKFEEFKEKEIASLKEKVANETLKARLDILFEARHTYIAKSNEFYALKKDYESQYWQVNGQLDEIEDLKRQFFKESKSGTYSKSEIEQMHEDIKKLKDDSLKLRDEVKTLKTELNKYNDQVKEYNKLIGGINQLIGESGEFGKRWLEKKNAKSIKG